MKNFTIFNQLTAMPKRIAMVLTVLFTLGVGSMWGETLTLNNLGAALTSTSNTTVSTTTVTATGDNTNTYTINYLQCKKQTNSSTHAMLLAKGTGAFISNKTAMPGNIKSVTVYVLTGAAGQTTYHCAFSTTECTKAYSTGSTAVNITGGNSNKYTCSVANAKYFCISLGNSNNGQVYKVDVEYEATATYTVTYKGNNGTTSCAGGTYTYNSSFDICPDEPTRTGYTFTGWSDGTNVYEAGDSYTMPAKDVTFTAQWTINTYTITWIVNGETKHTNSATHGGSVTAPNVDEIPCGDVIAGWTDAENGEYKHGTSKLYEGAKANITNITSDKTFYAVFADYAD